VGLPRAGGEIADGILAPAAAFGTAVILTARHRCAAACAEAVILTAVPVGG